MARKRNQTARRRELLDAAVSVIREHGPARVRMKDVARAANMAIGSVYYYYDDIAEVLLHVHHLAFERFQARRERAVALVEDPRAQLATMVTMGLPDAEDEPLSLAMYQVGVANARDPRHAELISRLCESQRELYRKVLDAGVRAGLFRPTLGTEHIAEHLIALEDGYGLGLCIGKEDYTFDRLHTLLLEAAAAWTDCPELGAWCDPDVLARLDVAHG